MKTPGHPGASPGAGESASTTKGRIRIGISACLLGEKVRYDGGHKLDLFLRDTLGRSVEYLPVCPEVGIGLPVPREAMCLIGDPKSPGLVTIKSRVHHTGRMKKWIDAKLVDLASRKLCGFVFKSRSPSCGMSMVKVCTSSNRSAGTSPGIFAKAFIDRFPLIPVEDEGRLGDPRLREEFIERVFAFRK